MDKKQNKKPYAIYGVVALAGIVVALAFFGSIGEEVNNRVVDAEINEEALMNDLQMLQESANQQQVQIDAMIEILQAHEVIVQQHDLQIRQVANNTNIIGNWATEFSQNINERVTALEEQP